jgi:hypothetical protein
MDENRTVTWRWSSGSQWLEGESRTIHTVTSRGWRWKVSTARKYTFSMKKLVLKTFRLDYLALPSTSTWTKTEQYYDEEQILQLYAELEPRILVDCKFSISLE